MKDMPEYEAWKEARAGLAPPEGFADRVMARVRRAPAAEPRGGERAEAFESLPLRTAAAICVLALGLGLGVLRTGLLVFLVLFTQGKGF